MPYVLAVYEDFILVSGFFVFRGYVLDVKLGCKTAAALTCSGHFRFWKWNNLGITL